MATRRLQRGLLPALLLGALAPAHARITFAATQPLAFGRFVAGTGGTITVSPSGARTRGGGVVLLQSSASAAALTYTDTNPPKSRTNFVITLPPDASVVLTSGTNQMTLGTFTSTPATISPITANGTLQISLGATLTVAPNQPKGNYSGSIPVSVDYQ
jgi:hypothetical protein